jgi:hypothetical protein
VMGTAVAHADVWLDVDEDLAIPVAHRTMIERATDIGLWTVRRVERLRT